jgi:hypothetical protein
MVEALHISPLRVTDGFFAWHGTDESAIAEICHSGFDPKLRKTQVYGCGEYFGVSASVSKSYCRGKPSRMILAFILCKSKLKTQADFCHVVDNPIDWKSAYNVPVIVVTFGESVHGATTPFFVAAEALTESEPQETKAMVPPFRWYWQQDSQLFEPYTASINMLLGTSQDSHMSPPCVALTVFALHPQSPLTICGSAERAAQECEPHL